MLTPENHKQAYNLGRICPRAAFQVISFAWVSAAHSAAENYASLTAQNRQKKSYSLMSTATLTAWLYWSVRSGTTLKHDKFRLDPFTLISPEKQNW